MRGHSYTGALALTKARSLFLSNGFRCYLAYYSVPGGTIPEFLELNTYIEYIREFRPDIIILVLGGNDLIYEINFQKFKVSIWRPLQKIVPVTW